MNCVIPLSRNHRAIVSQQDFDRVAAFKWFAMPKNSKSGGFYAYRTVKSKGVKRTVYLHRFIAQPAAGMVVDHIDGDGLNNTRGNLRVCTRGQNVINTPNRRDSAQSRGVYLQSGRWRARVQLQGTIYSGGTYSTFADAVKARDRLASELHGDFARLNHGGL